MDKKKVVSGIEKVEAGLAEIKAGLLSTEDTETTAEMVVEETPKKSGKKSKSTSTDTKSKKTAKADTKAENVESDDEEDEDEYAGMSYNQLKALAVKRGMKKPNVSKSEILSFLRGEDVDGDEEETIDGEEIDNDTDEEDLTAKVNELLNDVDTEDIADFCSENGISAKGKRESLIARIVTAIEDGDLSLDDLEVEEEEEEVVEEAPKSKKNAKKSDNTAPSKKSAKGKKVADPEPEEEDDDDSFFGYVYDDEEEVYVNEDEENELLASVTPDRMEALKTHLEAVGKDLKKKAKKEALIEELSDFFGDDYNPKKDDALEFAGIKFLLMTDDEGETHDAEDPYEINGVAVCCGQSLTETRGGYVCDLCGTEYDEE